MTIRLTKKRAEILAALQQSKDVFTAKTLHAKLPHIDLVTIYRAIEVFVADGVITKLALSSSEASYEYQEEPHHHAVCVDCDKVTHFTIKDEALRKLLPLENFEIGEVELVVKGRCG